MTSTIRQLPSGDLVIIQHFSGKPTAETITLQHPDLVTHATQGCFTVAGRGILCVPPAYVPLLTVFGAIITALIAGGFAILAATRQAAGAYQAAERQAKGATDAAAKQSEAIVEAQRIAAQIAGQAQKDELAHRKKGNFRELIMLFRAVGNALAYLAEYPDTPYESGLTWGVEQLVNRLQDKETTYLLTDEQAGAFHRAARQCRLAQHSIGAQLSLIREAPGQSDYNKILTQIRRDCKLALQALKDAFAKFGQQAAVRQAETALRKVEAILGKPTASVATRAGPTRVEKKGE